MAYRTLIFLIFTVFFLFLQIILLPFQTLRAADVALPGQWMDATSLSPSQARQLIAQHPNLLVVDVRTAGERVRAALADSIHVEMSDIYHGNLPFSPGQSPLLLYCAVGGRSSTAAGWLRRRGFSEVYELAGGITAWQRAGFEVVRGEKPGLSP